MQTRNSRFTANLLTSSSRTLVDINAFLGLKSSEILATNYDVISGEIFNLMTTAIGEEEFEPEYGSNIPNRVFDPMDGETERLLRTDLYLALRRWIPQIEIDLSRTNITWDRTESGRWWLFDLAIIVPNFGRTDNVSIRFDL